MDISEVILSLDKYSDLWPTFFECAKRYWHVEMPVYLVTNHLKPEFPGITTIQTGDEVSWSRRARAAIEKIPSNYILLMLEDYFIISDFSNVQLDPILTFIEQNSCDYLRIYPIPDLRQKEKKDVGIYSLPSDSLYGVNLQPAIWNREYLLTLLGNDDFSAWEFEARQKNDSPKKIPGKLYSVNYYPFVMVNGVLQGKWYPSSVKKLDQLGIQVDLSHRPLLSKKNVAIYKIKIIIRKVLGPNLIRTFKPLLKKLGFKFVTD